MVEPQQQEMTSEKRAAIRLGHVHGLGPIAFQKLLDQFGSAEKVLRADEKHLMSVSGVGKKLAAEISKAEEQVDVQDLFHCCESNQIDILTRSDTDYPSLLNEIHNPPNLLYVQGKIKPVDSLSIAIVGSRHATRYGKKIAESLGRSLAMAGFTIVSGLARGIDAAAHLGALQAGGRTIAVLGSGLLKLYPSEHANLAKQIVQQGAVISEYQPLQSPKSGSFPQRNRIVTGLSLGVVVVEAAQRSGALISARLAQEQNREVFAVPGQIDSRMSHGCHKLLQDGAKLVQNIDDIIEELGPLALPARMDDQEKTIRHPAELKLTDQESKILNAIGVQPTQLDDVIAQTGLPTPRVLATISVLEMRRLVKRIGGAAVARI